MCSAWCTPCGDLTNDAVVCAASSGKPVIKVTSLVRRVRGMSMEMKPAKRETRRAKLEFLRKG
jgi:hypothetical protein